MQISSSAINKNEMFPCSKKKVKEIFGKTEIRISFGFAARTFSDNYNHPTCYYTRKNVKGKVIADGVIGTRVPNPLFCFYIFKKDELSDDIVREVEDIYLNKILDIYMKQLNNTDIIGKRIYIVLEVVDNKLKMHVTELKNLIAAWLN